MDAGKEQDTLVRWSDQLGWSTGYRQKSRRREVQTEEKGYSSECQAKDCTWFSKSVGASEWDSETCMIKAVFGKEEITSLDGRCNVTT